MSKPSPKVIGPHPSTYRLSHADVPILSVDPGTDVVISTSDQSYAELTTDDFVRGRVRFDRLNQATGPIKISGTLPGDAIGFQIDDIDVGEVVHIPRIERWSGPLPGLSGSGIIRYPVRDGNVIVCDAVQIPVRPMIGAIASAPASGSLSMLAPTGRTGGNLDLSIVRSGAIVWLPVEVAGALIAVGDIHAAMGEGEPMMVGLECSGVIRGRFHTFRTVPLDGPRIESNDRIHFIGTDPRDWDKAKQIAIVSAWNWLNHECHVQSEEAYALSAAMMNVSVGGPAGRNAVTTFDLAQLRAVGVTPSLFADRIDSDH